MEHNPYQDVDTQDESNVHMPYQQYINHDEQHRQQTDGYHHLAYSQSTPQQLMVNMAFVWQERILAIANSMPHYSHYIQ